MLRSRQRVMGQLRRMILSRRGDKKKMVDGRLARGSSCKMFFRVHLSEQYYSFLEGLYTGFFIKGPKAEIMFGKLKLK